MRWKKTLGGACGGNGCDEARSRDAQRIRERAQRVPVTPEWQAENAEKQAAYRQQRQAWIAEWEACYGRKGEANSAASKSPGEAPQSSEWDAAPRV